MNSEAPLIHETPVRDWLLLTATTFLFSFGFSVYAGVFQNFLRDVRHSDADTARAIAAKVGIEDVRFRLQPEEKVAAVRELGAHGRVMMVGDGINDAPALAAASVGVAMGGYGAGIATDAADIVITVESVERVADTIELGRRMVCIARQGILFGIGASFVLMILATFGLFPPAAGALLQAVLDLATILNALRVR